jgi:predicted transposase YbfD/YdcC
MLHCCTSDLKRRKLLKELDVAGRVVTLDAMHCQKTFEAAAEAQAHLMVQLKDNQPTLCRKVEAVLQRHQAAFLCADDRQEKTQPSRDPHRRGVQCPTGGRRDRVAA